MTGKQFQEVLECVDCEGFDYCFSGYSDFKHIEDKEFHDLRRKFLESRKALIEYLGADEFTMNV